MTTMFTYGARAARNGEAAAARARQRRPHLRLRLHSAPNSVTESSWRRRPRPYQGRHRHRLRDRGLRRHHPAERPDGHAGRRDGAPVSYPAHQPSSPYGGYGAKQPAGTA
uniref:Uncharacterized protein n=1 Tax=Setaria viridis TaxID=4556 RepID=A0A4U6UV91_SETVI|nr:hypothetical protein SEVIR_4G017300v2 [Setaria viridis]